VPTEPVLPAGTHAGGQDIGGLTLSAAAAKLDQAFKPSFARSVQLRVAGKRFTVRPKAVGFTFDALRTARRANIAARSAPKAPDGSVSVDVPLYTKVRPKLIAAQTALIAKRTTVAPRDATARITLFHVRATKARPGQAIVAKNVRERLTKTFSSPTAPRILRLHRRHVPAKVTIHDLKVGRYGTVITVDQAQFRLRLFKRFKLVKSYSVAVGQPAYPTPNGLFSIANKAVNPTWNVPDSPWAGALRNETVAGGSSQNPLKARWMGIVNGVGIHGTAEDASIGSRASHGCIRMHVWDVIDLYPRVPIGTPVLIG
jgi:lipoprotein-anchoring transpeptidase ErfK/SrfK